MIGNKLQWFIYPLLIGFGVAYLVTGVINYTIKPTLTINSSGAANVKRPVSSYSDKSAILKRNVFDIEKGTPVVGQAKGASPSNNSAAVQNDFSGSLLGVLKSSTVSYAVLKMADEVLIIEEGQEKEGILLRKIHPEKVEIEVNGKVYFPVYKESTTSPATTNRVSKPTPNNIKVTDNKVSIPRTVLVNELKDINKVLKSVFVSPYYKSGEFVGYRLSRLRRTSIFKKIGLQNGDIIVNVNGEELSTPEKLFELFGKAEDLTAITVDMLRRGKKETLFVEIN